VQLLQQLQQLNFCESDFLLGPYFLHSLQTIAVGTLLTKRSPEVNLLAGPIQKVIESSQYGFSVAKAVKVSQ
jgi:hypothetical protein